MQEAYVAATQSNEEYTRRKQRNAELGHSIVINKITSVYVLMGIVLDSKGGDDRTSLGRTTIIIS